MRAISRLLAASVLFLSLVSSSFAQESKEATSQQPTPTVTAFASGERVRFTAPSSVVQIRLEVYNPAGRKLFDNELHGGNVLDWLIQDGQAARLADGSYLCVVTVKDLSGKLTQRIASVTVEKDAASLRAADASQMTPQQIEAAGPVEDNGSLVVLDEDQHRTATVIAHNGEDGQIARGKGALSFRLGDFYSGKDTEQMRLTPEGNLGIGITHPQVKLDVDGLIRASQGIVFPDGTVQYSAASRTLGASSTTWDGNGGTPKQTGAPSQGGTGGRRNGDVRPMTAGVFDVNANGGSYNINAARMGIGTANPLVRLHVGPGAAPPVTAGATLLLEEGIATSMVMKSTTGGEMFAYQDQNNGTFGTASTHPLGIRTNNINRIWVEAQGNVGIGTMDPRAQLAVQGDGINVLLGSAGCGAPTAAIGFGAMSGCTDYALGANVHLGPDAGIFINRREGNSLHFREGNQSDQMTILPGGRAGIGTSSPDRNLTVQSSSGTYLNLKAGNGAHEVLLGADGTGGIVSTMTNHDLQLRAGGNDTKVIIKVNGDVGIGTTSPTSKLEVGGNALVYPLSGSGALRIRNRTSSNGSQVVFSDDADFYRGYLGYIGANALPDAARNNTVEFGTNGTDLTFRPNETEVMRLKSNDLNGEVHTLGDIEVHGRIHIVDGIPFGPGRQLCLSSLNYVSVCSSSLRYKTNAQPFTRGLDVINRLRPISFRWKQGGKNDIGLGAEEVARVEPLLTFTNAKGDIEGVKYDRLSVVLINSIKQQQNQIKTLRRANAALSASLRALEKRLRKRARPPSQIVRSKRTSFVKQLKD